MQEYQERQEHYLETLSAEAKAVYWRGFNMATPRKLEPGEQEHPFVPWLKEEISPNVTQFDPMLRAQLEKEIVELPSEELQRALAIGFYDGLIAKGRAANEKI